MKSEDIVTMLAQIIHQTIDRPWRDVYTFASDPWNIHLWAAGLAKGLTPHGDIWIADGGPIGMVKIRFLPSNDFGVIDHIVTMPDGFEVYNALRVTPNGQGALISFTLLKLPEMSEDDFNHDASLVTADLATLKRLIESG